MDPVALWVTVGGAVAAVAVNLYFFAPRRPVEARVATPEGAQEVRITVRGGYEPAAVEVRAGRPVRLVFHREEVEGCSDTVLLPEWGIVQQLPAHQDTAVEFTPLQAGEFEFTCGMHMMRGKVVVR
jgi:plastocyanin domain-containing protein